MADLPFSEGLALLEKRARVASLAIWATIASGALMALGEFAETAGMVNINAAELDGPSMIVALVYAAFFLLYLVSVVLVSMWIYRAHANLFAAGLHDLEYTPGWSVGWFFVPIANLFKPVQAMRELWNASYGTSNSFGGSTPGTVSAWWACFIGGNILSNIGSRLQTGGAGTDAVAVGTGIGAVGTVLIVGAAWFLLQIVREVMEGQRTHLQVSEAFA
jgi:hypothetical protein